MRTEFRFTFEPDWRSAPIAYWVHIPTSTDFNIYIPRAPKNIPHKGYAVLRVNFTGYELQFSSPEQLEHCIEILSRKPLPNSKTLSARRGGTVGPNGHWLSRLPAKLKSPKKRFRLVEYLEVIRCAVVRGSGQSLQWTNYINC